LRCVGVCLIHDYGVVENLPEEEGGDLYVEEEDE